MVFDNQGIWRNVACLFLAALLVACTPNAPLAEELSNINMPTSTNPAQTVEPPIPARKADFTPIAPDIESWAANGEIMDPVTPAPEELPDAVQSAMRRLSDFLNITMDQIEVVSATQVQWRDECLGISSPGSVCPQVITPGWVIVLQADDHEYTFHTDQTGGRVRRR
jgi:hypothetical protein